MSEADELLKYKELLESGIITKDEFEKKKNEILNPESNMKKEINNDSLNNEKKKISNKKVINTPQKLGKINIVISWIFFSVFGLSALGGLTGGYNFSTIILYTLSALICCPPVIEKIQQGIPKFNITTGMRIGAIAILLALTGATMTANYKPSDDTINTNSHQISENMQNKVNPVFVSNTDGRDFFQNVLCENTKCEYKESVRLKADDIIPYDTVTYTTGNDIYSFEVTTNENNEIANIQMFFYKYGTEDPTNYFMAATRLNYPNSNVTKLASFITENIGKNEKIKIGDFTFHFFNGTGDNCFILDIYTDEFSKINGNE